MGNSFRDLLVWQKARTFAVVIYRATEAFPKSEIYGLTSQMRRAAVSVVSNVAEGQGRASKGEFIQFLGHARGSLLEVETQIEIAFELGYLERRVYKDSLLQARNILGLLNRLIAALREQNQNC